MKLKVHFRSPDSGPRPEAGWPLCRTFTLDPTLTDDRQAVTCAHCLTALAKVDAP